MAETVKSAFTSFFFEYDTVKMVHVKSRIVGISSRWVQLTILCYVFGWVIIWNKGYQRFDNGVSGVTAKVKGVQYANLSTLYPEVGLRVWDVADYVIPPHENNAFFVMTNFITTPGQMQGRCDEDPSVIKANCKTDSDCPLGRALMLRNGACTGRCINSSRTNLVRVCEIYAWCPVENDKPFLKSPILSDSRYFTVLIRNHVFFPYFEKYASNIVRTLNKTYLQSCLYNKKTDPVCPVFRLGDIVETIPGENFTELAFTGGVLSVRIDWDCNYDFDDAKCLPNYSFERLDKEKSSSIVKGYNFRTAQHYVDNGTSKRTLMKAYGILFLISVTAKAGAFNIVPLLLNVSSGLALMSVATIICDIVLLCLHRRRQQFKSAVYELVRGDTSASMTRASSQIPAMK